MNSIASCRRFATATDFLIILVTCVMASASTAAVGTASDEIPGAMPKVPIALVHAHIHPISSASLPDATLIFDQGKITAIGNDIPLPPHAQVIDVKGQHLYPGMIEAHSQLGLTEFDSIRASQDYRESGQLNPNVQAHVSINPDSELFPVTRLNGVLAALTAPEGSRIAGQGAVIAMDGWTCDDMTILPSAVMVVNLPIASPGDNKERREEIAADLKEIDEFFSQARLYSKRRAHDPDWPFDIRLEAMQRLVENKQPMLIDADSMLEIESAVAFAQKQNVKLIIFGGAQAPLCAPLLVKFDVPVIISSIHRVPLERYDAYDEAYTLPLRLQAAGVRYCISGSTRGRSWNARNLPYHAATAVAYGLSADDAMRSITLSAAQILGVDDRMGSLEVGKDATLIITNGLPLETTTQVTAAYILGKPVDLQSRHTRLYDKYQQKQSQLKN